jgi:MSHA pilin protein MshA
MNKSIKAAQGGFTLIELIVVIVILGILAATALPKFASLSGEARLASLNAAKGALSATSAMTHGKYLVSPGGGAAIANITVEGTAVAMDAASGYPAVTTQAQANALATAAGLSAADYTVLTASSTATYKPTLGASQLAIVPNSLASSANAAKCFVLYTGATAKDTAPTITVGGAAAPGVSDCE